MAEKRLVCDTAVQIENACLSLAVLRHLGVQPTGWKDFYWPCRMESFCYGGSTVVIDGCHNGNSVQKFLEGLRDKYADRHIMVLFGAGHEKCLKDMLSELLLGGCDSLVMVHSKHFRAMTETELLAQVPEEQQKRIIDQDVQTSVGSAVVSLGDRLQRAIDTNTSGYVPLLTCCVF